MNSQGLHSKRGRLLPRPNKKGTAPHSFGAQSFFVVMRTPGYEMTYLVGGLVAACGASIIVYTYSWAFSLRLIIRDSPQKGLLKIETA